MSLTPLIILNYYVTNPSMMPSLTPVHIVSAIVLFHYASYLGKYISDIDIPDHVTYIDPDPSYPGN